MTNLNETACFLFDMDGTIYLGEQLLPGAKEMLAYLDQQEKPYFFLTNNSSRSRLDYVEKLVRLGLDVSEEKIFTSGQATVIYLKRQNPKAKIFLVGTPSLEKEFADHGFELVQDQPDFVVLAFDTTLTYAKIRRLCEHVAAGVPYIATHPDVNCPIENGFIPDIGAVMALVAASTGRQADVVVGKPNPPIIAAIVEKTGFEPHQLTMVGDYLHTDIAMGQVGIKTVLVLSGESKRPDLEGAPHTPDYIFDDLAGLLGAYRQ